MTTYTPGWALLGQTVQRRRERLGVTQEQVAAAGGPSTATLRNIENGTEGSYRSKTLFSLDGALGWSRGTSVSLVEGDVPHWWFTTDFDEFVEYVVKEVQPELRYLYDSPVGATEVPEAAEVPSSVQMPPPPADNSDDSYEVLAAARSQIQQVFDQHREHGWADDSAKNMEVARQAIHHMNWEGVEALYSRLQIMRQAHYRDAFAGKQFPKGPEFHEELSEKRDDDDPGIRELKRQYTGLNADVWSWQDRATEALLDLHHRRRYAILTEPREKVLLDEIEEAQRMIDRRTKEAQAIEDLLRQRLNTKSKSKEGDDGLR